MGRMLPGCGDAVMTGAAGAQYLGVIDSDHGCPEIRGVAVLADIGRLNMCRTLTRRVCAVVTACTVASDVRVIEVCR